MRKAIAMGFMGTGLLAGLASTAFYIYFMWTQDWGPMGTRGHNLMFVLMLFGSVVVFLVALAIFAFIAVSIDKDMGR